MLSIQNSLSGYLDGNRQVAVPSALVVVVALIEPAFRVSGFGYGYSVAPYGTAYRSALRTSRIRRTTRALVVVVALIEAAKSREIGSLLPNNRRQRRTCYALCHIRYPVSAAHTSIFRMDSNSTTTCEKHASLITHSVMFIDHTQCKTQFIDHTQCKARFIDHTQCKARKARFIDHTKCNVRNAQVQVRAGRELRVSATQAKCREMVQ